MHKQKWITGGFVAILCINGRMVMHNLHRTCMGGPKKSLPWMFDDEWGCAIKKNLLLAECHAWRSANSIFYRCALEAGAKICEEIGDFGDTAEAAFLFADRCHGLAG